jgi:hypothetical protein
MIERAIGDAVDGVRQPSAHGDVSETAGRQPNGWSVIDRAPRSTRATRHKTIDTGRQERFVQSWGA